MLLCLKCCLRRVEIQGSGNNILLLGERRVKELEVILKDQQRPLCNILTNINIFPEIFVFLVGFFPLISPPEIKQFKSIAILLPPQIFESQHHSMHTISGS